MRAALRAAAAGDLDALAALEAGRAHPWSRRSFADSLAAGHRLVLALCGDVPAGYSCVMDGYEEAELLNIAVAAGFRRQGIGAQLLADALSGARSRGMAAMLLEVRASNAPAIALYGKAGFVRCGLRWGYYPGAQGREDAVLMRLEL